MLPSSHRAKDKHFSVMFAWQIYLFMTNSCDFKWKTIMVFSGLFPSLQCAAEINHSMRRKTKLSESDGDTLLTVFKKNHQKLSRVDHRSIFHRGASECDFVLRFSASQNCLSLGFVPVCKWDDKNQPKKAIYVTVLALSRCYEQD